MKIIVNVNITECNQAEARTAADNIKLDTADLGFDRVTIQFSDLIEQIVKPVIPSEPE